MNMKLANAVSIACIGLLTLQGCQKGQDGKIESSSTTANVEEVKALQKGKNIYSSVALDDHTVLAAGENGMSLLNMSVSNANIKFKKEFKKAGNTFLLPIFSSYDQVEMKKQRKVSLDSNVTEEAIEQPKIYSMLKLEDGILVGGKFATVNGVAQDNLVKLKYDGSIDSDFNASVSGAVYKIIKVKNDIYVAGVFGGYNEQEAFSIVKINSKGAQDAQFAPFKDYFLAKINDVEAYGTDKLILAGTFIKEIGSQDENATKEELLTMTKSVMVIDKNNGNIIDDESNKFNDIRNEAFSILKNDSRLYIAGDFEFSKQGKYYNNLVAFGLDGEFDSSFQIDKLYGMIFDVAASDDKIVFGGDFITQEDENSTNRSFYVVDKSGKTIRIDNFTSDSDIYNIDVYNGNLIISGEGEFKINDQKFANGIILKISQ